MWTAWWVLRERRLDREALRRALSAGALVALAAAASVPYREARKSGAAYECRYGLDSIGPRKEAFRAQIRGEDLHALEELDLRSFQTFLQGAAPKLGFAELSRDAMIHWWLLGGVQYIWWPKEGQAIRFDLAAVRAVDPGFPVGGDAGGDAFLSPVPPADAACTAIPSADLALPAQVVFSDETQRMIDGAREQQRANPPPQPANPRRAQPRSANPP